MCSLLYIGFVSRKLNFTDFLHVPVDNDSGLSNCQILYSDLWRHVLEYYDDDNVHTDLQCAFRQGVFSYVWVAVSEHLPKLRSTFYIATLMCILWSVDRFKSMEQLITKEGGIT